VLIPQADQARREAQAPSSRRLLEDGLSVVVLVVLAAVPLCEFGSRALLHRSLSGSIPLSQHLTLCITFLGAAIAAQRCIVAT